MKTMLVVETTNGFLLIPHVDVVGQHFKLSDCIIADKIQGYGVGVCVASKLEEFFKPEPEVPAE